MGDFIIKKKLNDGYYRMPKTKILFYYYYLNIKVQQKIIVYSSTKLGLKNYSSILV